jgi:predicted dehydrogenase
VTVGVGVLGSGFMGRTWSNVALASEQTHLAGLTGGRRAAALAEDLDSLLFESYEALLRSREVDLVVLSTPPAGHADQTLAAASAGKSVLVEKPMAQSVAECDAMIDACRRAGVVLAVVSQHRFRSAPRKAYELIRTGRLGSVNMVRAVGPSVGWWDVEKTQDAWKLDPDAQTAYASWGAHACDLIRWFVADEPELTFAVAGQYAVEPPPGRSAMVTYRFARGAMAQLWMSYDVPPPGLGSGLQLQLVGDRGMIELDCYGAVRLGEGDGWSTVHEGRDFDALDPDDPGRLLAYRLELEDVVAAMTTGRRPLVDGHEGRQTTAMLEAAERSAATGDSVRVPPPR